MFERPYFPVVYVRGYAMTQTAVESTVADPYMGFNVGSTKARQLFTREIARQIFESPLIRLMKDEEYEDIYSGGAELPGDQVPPAKSVWIYRYYEPVSKDLGTGIRPEIEDYARGLGELIDSMQQQFCRGDAALEKEFRVYLVAHSMGGLICRCYLQNVRPGDPRVDKLFTYATPHGGIDLRGLGNVPDFLQLNNSENFNEKRMREYLKISAPAVPVHSLDGKFDPARVFSLVGTNHRDYGAARKAVGPMSDGLVLIKNAYADRSPRAFVHRSHSGDYGIVNSEEGYQNLRRFLFGNVRVDAFLAVDGVTLPPEVQRKMDDGKQVRASYHVEVIGRVRGVRWDLHRRTVDEESAIFASFGDLMKPGERIHLASTFLTNQAKVTKRRRSLGFSLDLRVLVPEYVVDGIWFNKNHYDGGYLYRDKINLEASHDEATGWSLRYGYDSSTPNRTSKEAVRAQLAPHRFRFELPVEQKTKPGLKATLHLETRPWNT